jgi:hypothetical protein
MEVIKFSFKSAMLLDRNHAMLLLPLLQIQLFRVEEVVAVAVAEVLVVEFL